MIAKLIAGALAWAALLTFAPLVWPQPGVAKGGPGPSGNVRDAGADSFTAAVDRAKAEGKPLVLFVNTPAREIAGCVVVWVPDLDGNAEPRVTVAYDGKVVSNSLPSNASASAIRHVAGLEVARAPIPFPSAGPSGTAQPDDSPWLSREESDAIKAAWPKGVAWIDGLRFYSLPRRYQRLYTMRSQPYRDIVPLEDASLQFVHSGGMAGLSGWTSHKGLAIPDGKRIKVWEEDTDVRAFALTPRFRWSFPKGTVAVDMLCGPDGKPFEVRMQTKGESSWSTSVIHKDANAAPVGYKGLSQSCASCHDNAEAIVSTPGRLYLHSIWGSDGRFSWRPFDDNGQLDRRWPIE